jgi:hypothetical protein
VLFYLGVALPHCVMCRADNGVLDTGNKLGGVVNSTTPLRLLQSSGNILIFGSFNSIVFGIAFLSVLIGGFFHRIFKS